MLADIFVTTKNRPTLLEQMLSSLRNSTPREQFRLTIVHDGTCEETRKLLESFRFFFDHKILHSVNEGLGPSMNQALAFIGALKSWDKQYVPLTCYVQDDVVFSKNWLQTLVGKFLQLETPLALGFASGHDAVEHRNDPRACRTDLGNGMYTSKYIRATCMLAHHTFWSSMLPIPRVDPETGQERGRPHDGLGSGVDWHFLRVHPGSVAKRHRTNLVIPGLVVHAGFRESTWLKRELPESENDKKIMTCRHCNHSEAFCTCGMG